MGLLDNTLSNSNYVDKLHLPLHSVSVVVIRTLTRPSRELVQISISLFVSHPELILCRESDLATGCAPFLYDKKSRGAKEERDHPFSSTLSLSENMFLQYIYMIVRFH